MSALRPLVNPIEKEATVFSRYDELITADDYSKVEQCVEITSLQQEKSIIEVFFFFINFLSSSLLVLRKKKRGGKKVSVNLYSEFISEWDARKIT